MSIVEWAPIVDNTIKKVFPQQFDNVIKVNGCDWQMVTPGIL